MHLRSGVYALLLAVFALPSAMAYEAPTSLEQLQQAFRESGLQAVASTLTPIHTGTVPFYDAATKNTYFVQGASFSGGTSEDQEAAKGEKELIGKLADKSFAVSHSTAPVMDALGADFSIYILKDDVCYLAFKYFANVDPETNVARDFDVTCLSQKVLAQERVLRDPLLKQFGQWATGEGLDLQKQEGKFSIFQVHSPFFGGYLLMMKQDPQGARLIFSGQESVPCSYIAFYKMPEDLLDGFGCVPQLRFPSTDSEKVAVDAVFAALQKVSKVTSSDDTEPASLKLFWDVEGQAAYINSWGTEFIFPVEIEKNAFLDTAAIKHSLQWAKDQGTDKDLFYPQAASGVANAYGKLAKPLFDAAEASLKKQGFTIVDKNLEKTLSGRETPRLLARRNGMLCGLEGIYFLSLPQQMQVEGHVTMSCTAFGDAQLARMKPYYTLLKLRPTEMIFDFVEAHGLTFIHTAGSDAPGEAFHRYFVLQNGAEKKLLYSGADLPACSLLAGWPDWMQLWNCAESNT